LMQESSVIPTKIQGGGTSQNPADAGSGGWGIAQWTPGAKIINTAARYHITGPIYELGTQLLIIMAEMQNTSPPGYHNMLAGLKQIQDINEATAFFESHYEAAKDHGNLPQRQKYASDALAKYAGSAPTTTATTGACPSTASPDCQNVTGVAKILCAAKVYDPVSYEESTRGGHQGAAAWHQACPVIGPSCYLDCSGLVNIAVFDAFGIDLNQNTDGERADSTHWAKIDFSQLQPGDLIQPNDGHVEIVDHIEGNKIYTFGAHSSHYPQPDQVSPSSFTDNPGNLYLHFRNAGN
jgi:hypothetical protein